MSTDIKVPKKLSFKILRLISLIPILMWPLIFYGSLFFFSGPTALENQLITYVWFFGVNAYPLYLLGNLYLSNKFYYRNRVISYGLLIWPIVAMLIFLIMIFE